MGAAAGVGLATLGAQALLGFLVREGDAIPLTAMPDWRVLAFTAVIAIATGLIFGLVPALQSTRGKQCTNVFVDIAPASRHTRTPFA